MNRTFASASFLLLLSSLFVGCYVEAGPGVDYQGPGGSTSPGPSADQCNPVTVSGCSGGATCDVDPQGFFACFPPPNPVEVCGECDSENGPFCGPQLTCVQNGPGPGSCYRYCCTNADCGPGTVCDTSLGDQVLTPANGADTVGLCVTDLESDNPSCASAPAPAPSSGACVGGFAGGTTDAGVSAPEADATDSASSAKLPGDGGASQGGDRGALDAEPPGRPEDGGIAPDAAQMGWPHDGGWGDGARGRWHDGG